MGHQFRGRLIPAREHSHLMLVPQLLKTTIAFPTIGMNEAASLNRLFDERFQTARRSILDSSHPYSACGSSIFLHCNRYQGLFFRLAPSKPLFRAAYVSFVHLDSTRQPVASRTHHGTPQFVQPRPRCSVATQTQNLLHAQGAGSCFERGDPPHGPEPQHQWFVRVLEDRSGCHGGVIPAAFANYQSSRRLPGPVSAATRTGEAFRPSELKQIIAASFFSRKPRFEFRKRSWVVFHDKHYM